MSKPTMKAPLVLGAALVTALVVGGGYWFQQARHMESTDNAYIEAEMSVLAARVVGYVEEVYVTENQLVTAGQPLFRLNAADYQARAEQAAADLASREAAAITRAEQLRLQDSLILRSEAQLDSAEAEQARAQQDHQRYRALIDSRATSRQQLALSRAQAEQARAAVQAAQADLRAQRQSLVVLQAQQKEAETAVATARAVLKQAAVDLANTEVYAPVAGVIGNKQLELGQYLQPGTPVITVVPLNQLHITANFKETQVGGLRIGQPVAVTVDAYPDQPLQGHIESAAPATGSRFSLLPPENATGNFTKIVQRIPVRIALPVEYSLKGLLRPGLSVLVDIDTRAPGAPLSAALAPLFEAPDARLAMQ